MPEKELYIHIGAHKAGSTSLQQSLLDHSFALRAVGVRYVNTGRQQIVGPHYALSTAAQHHKTDGALRMFRALAREIAESEQRKFVISSEAFESLPGVSCLSPFAEMKEALGLSVKVLFLVRRHTQQLASSYVQLVRELAISETFNAYVRRRMVTYNRRYRRCIENWSELADRLDIIELSPENVEGYLLREFGIPITLSHRNRSANIIAVEALRRYREALRRKSEGAPIRRAEHEHRINAILSRSVEFDDLHKPFWGYGQHLFDSVVRNCAEDRHYLAEQFDIAFEESNDKPRSILNEPMSEADKERLLYVLHG